MTSIDRLTGTVRNGLSLRVTKAMHDEAIAALDELAALARETTEAYEGQAGFGAQQMQRAEAAEARVSELAEAASLALRGIPDAMHPGIPREFVDGLVHAQIVLLDAIGDDDPGNVEAARAALAADRTEEPRDESGYPGIQGLEAIEEYRQRWLHNAEGFAEQARIKEEALAECDRLNAKLADVVSEKVAAEAALIEEMQACADTEHELDEARAALEKLADIHHRTLTNSRLHDPERIESFTDCPCKTCREATAALAADRTEELVCSECGRDLHGYRGPRCRYCDGTAE